jgi:hypothetical protein
MVSAQAEPKNVAPRELRLMLAARPAQASLEWSGRVFRAGLCFAPE